MSDSERLIALKEAYAKTILHTAEDAAARIIVSERKALQYQKELADTKKEALRMLMRFKQMIDFKANEAQMACIDKQRKIDELEAQLHEAEDIVKDLREELQEVQAELERVSYNQQQQYDERDLKSHGPVKDVTVKDIRLVNNGGIDCSLHTKHTDANNSTLLGSHQDTNFHYKINFQRHSSCIYNPGFDVKSYEEPECYRCTESGCAIKGNFTFRGRSEIDGFEKEKPNRGHLEPKDVYVEVKPLSEDTRGVGETQKEYNTTQAYKCYSEIQNLKPFHRKRKRGGRSKSEEEQAECHLEEIPTLSFCKQRRAHMHGKGEANGSAHASVENHLQLNESSLISGCEYQSDIEKPQLLISPFHKTESASNLRCSEDFERHTEVPKEGSLEDTITKDEMSKLDSTEQLYGYPESTRVSACKADETEERSMVGSVLEVSNSSDAVQSQHVANRLIKFTFQRRSKKETLSGSDDNSSFMKCISSRAGEKQTGCVELRKSPTKSTRESRRLAQVARQLLSLSGKKR